MERKPLAEQDVVVHVPKGTARHVRIEETEGTSQAEIVVQVSRRRRPGAGPVLGVIVK